MSQRTRTIHAKTPRSIEVEHEELLEELARLASIPGEVGAAAGSVSEVLRPHFERETVLALPPLGILRALEEDPVGTDSQEVRDLVHDLRGELPTMLREHRQIMRALERLSVMAAKAGEVEGVDFTEKLRLHAQLEEEVLYPAALLIGRFLDEHSAMSRGKGPAQGRRRSRATRIPREG